MANLGKTTIRSDYSQHVGKKWVHYSKFPELKLNPRPGHHDPIGLYLFPESFKPHSFWQTMPYRFEVEVPANLKVLDFAQITDAEFNQLVSLLEKETGKKWVRPEKLEHTTLMDYFWDSFRGLLSPAKQNAILREAGYDAVFDDTKAIHVNEDQLIVLTPSIIQVAQRIDQRSSGVEEAGQVAKWLTSLLQKSGGVINQTGPRTKSVWGKKIIEFVVEQRLPNGASSVWQIYPAELTSKDQARPEAIRVHLRYASGNLTSERSYGGTIRLFEGPEVMKENYARLTSEVEFIVSKLKEMELVEKRAEADVNYFWSVEPIYDSFGPKGAHPMDNPWQNLANQTLPTGDLPGFVAPMETRENVEFGPLIHLTQAEVFLDEGITERGYWGSSASGLLIQESVSGKVLLLKRAHWTQDPLTWGIPGGAIPVTPEGEKMSAWDSALKESQEEIGHLPGYQDELDKTVFTDGKFTYTTFLITVAKEFTPKLNNEHLDYGWFDLNELPEDTHPGVLWSISRMGKLHRNPEMVQAAPKDEIKEKYQKTTSFLHYPVSLNGDTDYHITVKFFAESPVTGEEIEEALKGLDLSPLSLSEIAWKPVEFESKEWNKIKVLELTKFPKRLQDMHDRLEKFHHDQYPNYRPHVTVEDDLWEYVQLNKLSPGDLGMKIGKLTFTSRGVDEAVFARALIDITHDEKTYTIFQDPNPKELNSILEHDEVRAFLLPEHVLAWNVFSSVHYQVSQDLKLGKDAIPVILHFIPGQKLTGVTVTDFSRNTKWHHNPEVYWKILNHPFVKLKGMGETVEVGYYDEAIVGAWHEVYEEEPLTASVAVLAAALRFKKTPTKWNGKTPEKTLLVSQGISYVVEGDPVTFIKEHVDIPEGNLYYEFNPRPDPENKGQFLDFTMPLSIPDSFFSFYRDVVLVEDMVRFTTYQVGDKTQETILGVLLARKDKVPQVELKTVSPNRTKKVSVQVLLKEGEHALASGKNFPNLIGLQSLSEKSIKNHLSLYEMYLAKKFEIETELESVEDNLDGATYSEAGEIYRSYAVARNGVLLHELFFDNLIAGGSPMPHELIDLIYQTYGSVDALKLDLRDALGTGQGWAVLVRVPEGLRMMAVEEHTRGIFLDATPLLVLDGWEHAYFGDYGVAKVAYFEAIWSEIDWIRVYSRYKSGLKSLPQTNLNEVNLINNLSPNVGESAIKGNVWLRPGHKSSKNSYNGKAAPPLLERWPLTCSKAWNPTQSSLPTTPQTLLASKMNLNASLLVKSKARLQHLPDFDKKLFEDWIKNPDPSCLGQLGGDPTLEVDQTQIWLFRLKFSENEKQISNYRGLGWLLVSKTGTLINLMEVRNRDDLSYREIKEGGLNQWKNQK